MLYVSSLGWETDEWNWLVRLGWRPWILWRMRFHPGKPCYYPAMAHPNPWRTSGYQVLTLQSWIDANCQFHSRVRIILEIHNKNKSSYISDGQSLTFRSNQQLFQSQCLELFLQICFLVFYNVTSCWKYDSKLLCCFQIHIISIIVRFLTLTAVFSYPRLDRAGIVFKQVLKYFQGEETTTHSIVHSASKPPNRHQPRRIIFHTVTLCLIVIYALAAQP